MSCKSLHNNDVRGLLNPLHHGLGRSFEEKRRACCLSGFVHCAVACWAARLIAKKWRTFFAAVYMTSSQQALAPRSSTTLDTVHDILGTLVARYRTDEVLTCLRQIPAREASVSPDAGLGEQGTV